MFEQIFIGAYILMAIGHCIEIYSMIQYEDAKTSSTCLWTANGGVSMVLFVYSFENRNMELATVFIVQYIFCFICLSINLYYVGIKGRIRMYRVNEQVNEKDANFVMDNPLYGKYPPFPNTVSVV